METSLLELNRSLIALDAEYETKAKEFNQYKESFTANRKKLLDLMNLSKHAIDIEKFERGKRLLALEFPCNRDYRSNKRTYYAIYGALIADAEKDLSTGAKKLSREYIGQKRYEGFDQRCDCQYGYVPSHGSIYQSIGLRNPDVPLSDEDIEACLYLLKNIDIVLENANRAEPLKG